MAETRLSAVEVLCVSMKESRRGARVRRVGEAWRRSIRFWDRRWGVLYQVKASDAWFTVRNVSTRLSGEDVAAWRSQCKGGSSVRLRSKCGQETALKCPPRIKWGWDVEIRESKVSTAGHLSGGT